MIALILFACMFIGGVIFWFAILKEIFDMRRCQFCMMPYNRHAVICPHCHSVFPKAPIQDTRVKLPTIYDGYDPRHDSQVH